MRVVGVELVDWGMEMLNGFGLKVIVGLGYEMKEDLDIYIYILLFLKLWYPLDALATAHLTVIVS